MVMRAFITLGLRGGFGGLTLDTAVWMNAPVIIVKKSRRETVIFHSKNLRSYSFLAMTNDTAW